MVEISKANQEIINEVLQEVTLLGANDQEAFKDLQKAAKTFIEKIEETIKIEENHKQHFLNCKNIAQLKPLLEDFQIYVREQKNNKAREKNINAIIATAMHNFDKALDIFLNRKTHLTVVLPDGTIFVYGDIGTGQVYDRATGNKGLQASIRMDDDLKDLVKQNTQKGIDIEILNHIRNLINAGIENKKGIYAEASKRFDNSPNMKYSKVEFEYNNKYSIYWWISHGNLGGKSKPLTDRGDVAEAYIESIVNPIPGVLMQVNHMEQSLQNLSTIYIDKHDSISALKKADIIIKGTHFNNISIQLAVKAGPKFNSQRYRQYIVLAYNLLNLPPLSKAALESIGIDTLGNTQKERLIEALEEATNKKVQDLINEIDIKKV